jgi:hypothetical protein
MNPQFYEYFDFNIPLPHVESTLTVAVTNDSMIPLPCIPAIWAIADALCYVMLITIHRWWFIRQW